MDPLWDQLGGYILVSMKSGLEGRNNIVDATTGGAGENMSQ